MEMKIPSGAGTTLQSFTGILTKDWEGIQNIYLQSLGAKIYFRRCISSLIKNIWRISWDLCHYRNHTLHYTDGPTNTDILSNINDWVNYHFHRVINDIPQQYHLHIKTNIRTLLSCLVWKYLSWISTSSISCLWSKHKLTKKAQTPNTNQLLITVITNIRLVTSLRKLEQASPLFTTTCTYYTLILLIERYDKPLNHHYIYPNFYLGELWNTTYRLKTIIPPYPPFFN